SGLVLILAAIAAAGSFTHIRETAAEHGQHGWIAWAVAVCIDLTCVMAARERQRDKRTGRDPRALSWPTVVLCGGILLSLAANLAQAQPTPWGWLAAATPAGAFLVAVSMLERRAGTARPEAAPAPDSMTVPASFGVPTVREPVRDTVPAPSPSPALGTGRQDDQHDSPVPSPSPSAADGPAPALLDFARRVAAEHHQRHGRPITRDALRARLGVSNALASELLRHVRTEPA
ncbi:MAG TPA: DUF2637 domain-containing protein, partial [Streptosporangiaceae bacterium]